MVDGYGERRLMVIGVRDAHRRQVEPIRQFGAHRRADQSASVRGHECDIAGGGVAGGADEVALVLPTLVVRHYHDAPRGDVADGAGHRVGADDEIGVTGVVVRDVVVV